MHDNLIILIVFCLFDCFQCVLLVLLEITVRSILTTALALCVITTVLVLTWLVTTVVAVDQDGLADCVITSWDLYAITLITITLTSARMEVFVSTLLTRTTTRVLVLLVSLDVTVNLNLTLVTVLHVSRVEHALSLDVMTLNVTVQQVRSLNKTGKYMLWFRFFSGLNYFEAVSFDF